MDQRVHKLERRDQRVKQWWGDELTERELERIATGECTVAEVLYERVRKMQQSRASSGN
jgi:hypothetical protein